MTVGVAALVSRGQYTEAYWYWIGVGALLGLTILYNVGFTIALGYMPALGTPQAILSEEDLAYKEATKVGSGALDEFALSSPSRKHSRSVSRRLSPGKAAKKTSSSPKSRELSELSRRNDRNQEVCLRLSLRWYNLTENICRFLR
jgi:hypothetical protein